MGVRLIVGVEAGTEDDRVAMFDSVTGVAFGPTFRSVDDAESFLTWLREHPWRRPSGLTFTEPLGLSAFELGEAVSAWRRTRPIQPRLPAPREAFDLLEE